MPNWSRRKTVKMVKTQKCQNGHNTINVKPVKTQKCEKVPNAKHKNGKTVKTQRY